MNEQQRRTWMNNGGGSFSSVVSLKLIDSPCSWFFKKKEGVVGVFGEDAQLHVQVLYK